MYYNLVLIKNTQSSNLANAHLPAEVQVAWNSVFSKESFEKYGVEWLVYCDCTWANEEYSIWAIHAQKDIPTRIELIKEIKKAGWYQYMDLINLLGSSDEAPKLPTFPNPIYQLCMIHNDPAAAANRARVSPEEEKEIWGKWQESIDRSGACIVLSCDSYWANEEWDSFGVVAFPSIEARQAHAADLKKLNWSMYLSAFTLLGVAAEE